MQKGKKRGTEPADRLTFASWIDQHHERLLMAVSPALNLYYSKIPIAKLESVRPAREDVLQAAAVNLLTNPKYDEMLLTFGDASRTYATAIKYLCERIAKKQRVRNRLGTRLEDAGEAELGEP